MPPSFSWVKTGPDDRLVQVSVGADGTAFGVNKDQNVCRWTGSAWVVTGLTDRLVQVSVGNAEHVMGVNVNDDPCRWTGSGWVPTGGHLVQVSVGADGTAFGVNGDDHVYQWRESEAERPYEKYECAGLQNELELLQAEMHALPGPSPSDKERILAAIKEIQKEQERKNC